VYTFFWATLYVITTQNVFNLVSVRCFRKRYTFVILQFHKYSTFLQYFNGEADKSRKNTKSQGCQPRNWKELRQNWIVLNQWAACNRLCRSSRFQLHHVVINFMTDFWSVGMETEKRV